MLDTLKRKVVEFLSETMHECEPCGEAFEDYADAVAHAKDEHITTRVMQ